MQGPTLPISQEIHAQKYRAQNESFREGCSRIAGSLQDSPQHFQAFREILMGMRFLPAGRVQSAMGTLRTVTPYNCLAGDTEILTLEYGSVEIQSVAGQEVHLLDGKGNWVKCPVLCHGEQTTYEMYFKGGYEKSIIRSTLGHGWIQPDGNVLLTSDCTSSTRKPVADLRPEKKVTDEVAYHKGIVHGIIYGDGTEQDGYRIRVCSSHEETEKYLVGFNKSYQPSNNGDPSFYLNYSKAWASLKELPVNFSASYLLGFLRGWFLADGCVSTQPEATLCGDETEKQWLAKWGPLVGWHVIGSSELAKETNFGPRIKQSLNIRFKTCSLQTNDFLLKKHSSRWETRDNRPHLWRIYGQYRNPRSELVYCPVVPTTNSFALSNGIHSRNCFVSGSITDAMVDGEGSIMARALEAAATMRQGGGIGYDFSTLRPRGALIKKLDSKSSGPVSFMRIYDAICKCIASSGHRRGAQMGVLRIDHPDVEEFIRCKQPNADTEILWETVAAIKDPSERGIAWAALQKTLDLTGFNISVAVTDEFMKCLKTGKGFDLKFDGQVYKTVDPGALWDMLMRSTWDWAEPGVLFIDTINKMNNLSYCEEIACTNPCGEQPLGPHSACLLGSFNLVQYVSKNEAGAYTFNMSQLLEDVPHVIRAMDNVVDRAKYPLREQEKEAKNKRRMGIGVTGLANAVEACGFPYGSKKFLKMQKDILSSIKNASYAASVQLSQEKGAFPLFDGKLYPKGKFIKTLDEAVQKDIAKIGIRNSHLTSIAPTGTISLSADNVSSGIEPVFSYSYDRTIQTFDGPKVETVTDYGVRVFDVRGKRSNDVSVDEHLNVLLVASEQVDSAVSKTCNVPGSVNWDEFKSLYVRAYEGGAKGCTTFRTDGKRMGILVAKENEEEQPKELSCSIDPSTGRRSCE